MTSYAFARTGYHRGLDQLRRNGWKGFGPVPWDHEPNQGFLRSVAALARAAKAIGETDEVERCVQLVADCDPSAVELLGLAERLRDDLSVDVRGAAKAARLVSDRHGPLRSTRGGDLRQAVEAARTTMDTRREIAEDLRAAA